MATEIIMAVVGVVCSAISGFVTFLMTKRKYNAEVDANQIQNISDAFNEYKKIMEATVDMLNKKIELLDKENADLRDQIEQLRKQVFTLMKNNLENEYAGKKHTSKTHS